MTTEELELALEGVRVYRNKKLTESDWTQLADAPLTAEQKTAYTTYRQELRDFPSTLSADNFGDSGTVDFPVEPS